MRILTPAQRLVGRITHSVQFHMQKVPLTGLLYSGFLMATLTYASEQDSHQWLEQVQDEAALAWVKQRNAETTENLAQSAEFRELQETIRAILDTKDRIPAVAKLGAHYYNFWQDENHERGILRRTSPEEYRKSEPVWETVLDLDQLGADESESWVWKGSTTLAPTYDRSLFELSRGGSDASVVREYDLSARVFVPDGFVLSEAKSDVAWLDRNAILVATDFGHDSLTDSGYPRSVKHWSRGQQLEQAEALFTAAKADVGAFVFSYQTKDYHRAGIVHAIDFFNSDTYLLVDQSLVHIEKPTHTTASFFRNWLLLEPKEDWQLNGTIFSAGSLLVVDLERYLQGERDLHTLFEPTRTRSLIGFSQTRNFLLLNILENVQSRIEAHQYVLDKWHAHTFNDGTKFETISVRGVDAIENDEYFITREGFLTPPTLAIGHISKPGDEVLKQESHAFANENLDVTQHWATSLDGTQIPYFQVAPKHLDQAKPTLLYGYGGFEISLIPDYQKVVGSAWLEPGGVYVVANIRGGGEFGPAWHRAALKDKRHKAYEDFIAVAEDLIARNVTTPQLLGTMGGSNGGLLVGNMYTQRPDLFGAVVSNVPLLDMQRYHKLLAGASWMAEFGDPDKPAEWEFLKRYSPYHNVAPNIDYPALLVTTSTADDRVHPGHARKFVARMLEYNKDVAYFENLEGGHAGAADNGQRALMLALEYRFLWETLASKPHSSRID